MRRPTIHLNGTSADALLDQYQTAAGALRQAIETLIDAYPNARDYYPQGAAAFHEAALEHSERVLALSRVVAELDLLAEHVQDDIDQKARRAS